MKIESKDTSIETLLTSDFLTIPRFQRPYSWDDENLEDFWSDIAQSGGSDYFIGSMVVFKSGRQEFGVVDGQQRLTTITILLCVIRNYFLELGSENLARGLHSLIERANRDSVTRYVLMTETSYPFFQEEIQKFGKPDFETEPQREERRLQAAFSYFSEKVAKLIEAVDVDSLISADKKLEEKIARLRVLRDSVLFLKIIRIELENEDDAYLIFETLNTRGKDLALTDLLKNHFNKLIKEKGGVDSVKEQWSQILSTLSESVADIDPDIFFTHSWGSRFEATTQQKAYKTIKSAVTAKNAKSHLAGFAADAKFYISIFAPESKWTKGERHVRSSLSAMRIFRISQPTPGVLSLIRSFRSGAISYKSLRRALAAIEDFHFLFTAVTSSRSSGGISAMYSSFGRRLYEADTSNAAGMIISDLIDKLEERKPSLSEFVVGFEQIFYTNAFTKQSALVRYILQRMAKHAGLAFSDDFSDLTIEHILPQSSISQGFAHEIVGSLGNLILLSSSQNQALKDDAFAAKKLQYRAWTNTVPEDVRTAEDWSEQDIVDRTKRLSILAYEDVWKVKP